MPFLLAVAVVAMIVAPPTLATAPQIAHAQEAEPPLSERHKAADIPNPAPTGPVDEVLCQCVLYLRLRHSVPIYGNADTLKPNIPLSQATVGDVLLLDYHGLAHAALITGFGAKGPIVFEANYHACQESVREVDLSREQLRGVVRTALPSLPSDEDADIPGSGTDYISSASSD